MKFWLVLFSFVFSLFAQSMTLSDFAFMVSQKEKLNIVFDKSVDKNITVFINPQTDINYLSLLNAVLSINHLDSFRVSDTLVISQSKVNDVNLSSSSVAGFSRSSSQRSFSSPVSDPSVSRITVGSPDNILYSAPFGRSDGNITSHCSDCVYEPIKLNFLNDKDLGDFLKFSGSKYEYIKNINTLVFERPKDDNSTVERIYNVIKSLDVSKRQVIIRLTVFETNLNKLSDIGINPTFTFDFNSLSKSGALLTSSASASFYGTLRFLETKNVTKVTNSPSFLVSNLDKMEFKSVINIPFLDENFSFTYQGTNQSKRYKYKPVGFRVNITPTIVDDYVYLDFDLAFENVVTGGDLPTTSEKSIKNKFMLRRGDIMLLAGIEKSSFLDAKEGLPLLSNVPVLGSLFSHDNKSDISETFNIAVEVLSVDTY